MASGIQSGVSQNLPPRGKPWLLPYNRRLRHLQGLTIRNLSLSQDPNRFSGKTVDDDGIPSSLRTPSKTVALREVQKLEHRRSSTDLRAHDESGGLAGDTIQKPKLTPNRPSATRLRRRSTMEWSRASPIARQKKLEDVADGQMADVFFSLHTQAQESPIYISEIATRTMNPTFRFFDLDPCGPSTIRLASLVVKIWAKTEHSAEYSLLVECVVELSSLQFIGKSLESSRQPLPINCIMFHLTDGIYTSTIDLPVRFSLNNRSESPGRPASHAGIVSSSYDALMRLSTLDDCIQDALNTREKLASDIELLLEAHKGSRSTVREVPEVEQRLKTIEGGLSTQRKRLEVIRKYRKTLSASIAARRDAIRKGREAQVEAGESIKEAKGAIPALRTRFSKVTDDVTGQRRRICEDLMRIYPIEPVAGRSLAFTIRGLSLPNSESESDVKDEEMAAALGFVAKIVYQLSLYLSVPLPYPITPRESSSSIEDPISLTNGPRVYPLFPKGTVRYRFEYGVFLLNKDIEIISSWSGLRLLDIRQTLPNLKYLLYVVTAGSGELPSRKAGGVRGLMAQTGASMSDTDSIASTVVIDGKGHKEATGGKAPQSGLKTHAPHKNGNAIRPLKAATAG